MESSLALSSLPPNLLTMVGDSHFPTTDMTKYLVFLMTGAAFPIPNAESVFTNLSFEPSWSWYFRMTPLESIFFGFIIAQFAVLNLVGIMPININQWINGMAPGRSLRKKRVVVDRETVKMREEMAQTMINVLKRMDRDECFLRALCEIQKGFSHDGYSLPRETKLTLVALKRSSDRWNKRNLNNFTASQSHSHDDEDDDDDRIIEEEGDTRPFLLLEEAVEHGLKQNELEASGNNSTCLNRYNSCPISTEDIFAYFEILRENYFK